MCNKQTQLIYLLDSEEAGQWIPEQKTIMMELLSGSDRGCGRMVAWSSDKYCKELMYALISLEK